MKIGGPFEFDTLHREASEARYYICARVVLDPNATSNHKTYVLCCSLQPQGIRSIPGQVWMRFGDPKISIFFFIRKVGLSDFVDLFGDLRRMTWTVND